MLKQDLSRNFFLDVCAAGSIVIRERGNTISDGRLPLFSTDTYDEATGLRVLHCRRARDNSGMYFLNNPPDEHGEDFDAIVDLFRSSYTDQFKASIKTAHVE